MIDSEIQEIIEQTVNQTVSKLQMLGLMKDGGLTSYQKTEKALKLYNEIATMSELDDASKKFIKKIDEALKTIEDDEYYNILPMIYFQRMTRESVAEYYDKTVTTISRHKTRLIDKIKPLIFSDKTIIELFL